MHADDAQQILGMPAPIAPGVLPNRNEIERAFRKFAKHWHPDKWAQNSFGSPEQASVVYMFGEDEKENLLLAWKDPYCEYYTTWIKKSSNVGNSTNVENSTHVDNSTNAENPSEVENSSKDEGLLHLKPGCVCTYPQALKQELYTALWPATWHRFPKTREQLAEACPCTFDIASHNSKAWQQENIPPPLRRNVDPVPWKTCNVYALLYKLKDWIDGSWEDEYTFMLISEQDELMEQGWAIKADFVEEHRRGCDWDPWGTRRAKREGDDVDLGFKFEF
ncbi:hypothetical protein EK21DRAFT_91757 [Setomelanomma holmii]|uniref:J domain-containing protein n=1 Tax=Setomelanomma holmii TaxID=210430 RepID=A0A9P4LKN5_9PLEO|nr:hypothetical protein EK21DRAFT_91757 [Setomelanomma holmii]